jgi:3-ketosteroid 9alpha-monooxygenase subunit A
MRADGFAGEGRVMLKRGFPYKAFPTGWYQVAWQNEVAAAQVLGRHYFGKDLVIYQAEDGIIRVAEATCPHMGANIACGGWVSGDNLVCPFHGWQFGPDGSNALIPNLPTVNHNRRLVHAPARTTNGIVWMWFDELGRQPSWEPPEDREEYGKPEYYPVYPAAVHRWEKVHLKPQYVVENNADMEHLHFVHKAQGDIELLECSGDGHIFYNTVRMTFGAGKKSTWLTPDGPVVAQIIGVTYGLGIIVDHFVGTDDAWLFQCQTPVDHETTDLFNSYIVRRPDGAQGEELEGAALARLREQVKQVNRDIVIWENLTYLQNPALTLPEGKPMATLRRWAAQFYPDAADRATAARPRRGRAAAQGS